MKPNPVIVSRTDKKVGKIKFHDLSRGQGVQVKILKEKKTFDLFYSIKINPQRDAWY